jgi:hypothetical protein
MSARTASTIVLTAVVTGAAVGGIALAQPAMARAAAISALPVLTRQQTPLVDLPDNLVSTTLGNGGLDEESARLLGKDAETSFWAALDTASNICLVAQSRAHPELSAATCPGAQDFLIRGAWLQVVSSEWNVEAQLQPDARAGTAPGAGWVRLTDALSVRADGAGK